MDIKLTIKIDDDFIEDVLKAFLDTAGTKKDLEDCVLELLEIEGAIDNIDDIVNECKKLVDNKLSFKKV